MNDCRHKHFDVETLQKPPSDERFRTCSACGKRFSSYSSPEFKGMTLDPDSWLGKLKGNSVSPTLDYFTKLYGAFRYG